MREFKSVIFDLDGTLIDSLPGIANSLNIVLKKFDLPEQSLTAVRSFIGNGIEKLVERSLPQRLKQNKDLVQLVTKQMKSEYGQLWQVNTKIFEGIKDILQELNEHEIKISVLTNKTDRFAIQIVRELFPEFRFSFVIGAGDKFPSKPSPEAVYYICKELKIPENKTMIVGDSGIDVQTAINSGAFPLGVCWGYQSKSSLKQSGCNAFVNRPSEIMDFLNF